MTVITLEGIVDQGQIRLKDNIQLPENTTVYVVVPGVPAPRAHRAPRVATPHLLHREDAAGFSMHVVDLADHA